MRLDGERQIESMHTTKFTQERPQRPFSQYKYSISRTEHSRSDSWVRSAEAGPSHQSNNSPRTQGRRILSGRQNWKVSRIFWGHRTWAKSFSFSPGTALQALSDYNRIFSVTTSLFARAVSAKTLSLNSYKPTIHIIRSLLFFARCKWWVSFVILLWVLARIQFLESSN